ncbi:MarR family winged helix-turn-helix transcriptional regulator [Clostridium sp.]|uniref:MarR family winged helix-turn-helix transcriptional regulator n=1 Tax=Clostridium sp. TaxID=1506 RepID=UPI00258D34C5|nr:MarR family winged helix-turn-helix transcriptional regulator [Clostridium sp.]
MKVGDTLFSIFDSMGFLFGKVTEQMIDKFNVELNSYQIDSKEFGLMTVVTSMSNSTQQQVGEVLHIDRTTMVKRVDHLEALGCLTRVKNAVDRRTYNLELTSKGEQMLRELWPTLVDCERGVLSALTDEELQNLKSIFTKLVKAWN